MRIDISMGESSRCLSGENAQLDGPLAKNVTTVGLGHRRHLSHLRLSQEQVGLDV
jgi:hypothetical protein